MLLEKLYGDRTNDLSSEAHDIIVFGRVRTPRKNFKHQIEEDNIPYGLV